MVGYNERKYNDKQKLDIIVAVFGAEQPLTARYHAGDIGCSILRGYLDADRSQILEKTSAPSQKGILGLYSDKRFKKGVFQVEAARVVPARLNLTRIRDAELYEAESIDHAVKVDFKDGILYSITNVDTNTDIAANFEKTAAIFNLEYKIK